MTIKLPDNVSSIIERLEAAGYEAYAVGGCVRDSLLGREPNDWDITTSALPERVKELFPRTIDTGIKHGTVSILIGKETYEVTTYRVDGKYSDSRHPDSVYFTRSLEEDLKRRDFTINAMAYSDRDGMVDMFDGAGDLEKRVIRCVGAAHERFAEDALRILRAVRFAAQLNFTIDVETGLAAAALAPTLAGISAERIHAELDKLLLSGRPDMVEDMYALGIAKVILPELDRYYKVMLPSEAADGLQRRGDASLSGLLAKSRAATYIRWAIMLACVCGNYAEPGYERKNVAESAGKLEAGSEGDEAESAGKLEAGSEGDEAERAGKLEAGSEGDEAESAGKIGAGLEGDVAESAGKIGAGSEGDARKMRNSRDIMRGLKFDNKTIFMVALLVEHKDIRVTGLSDVEMRYLMHEVSKENVPLLLEYIHSLRGTDVRDAMDQYDRIVAAGDCTSLKELAVSGSDLIAHGYQAGSALGDILARLLDEVIRRPELNTSAQLIEIAGTL